MGTILIKNSRIFDGHRFLSGDVFIRDGVVEKLGGVATEPAGFTFDAAGMTVLPGLVDVHMHIKGLSPDRWAAPADNSCLSFGVTAAADASSVFGDTKTFDAFGIHACAFVLTGTQKSAARLEQVDRDLRKYGDFAAGIKLCYDVNDDPNIRDAEALAEISLFAKERGLRLTVHTSNCPIPMEELLAALNPGDIATHIYHGGGHTAIEDGFACLQRAKKRGVLLDAGLAGKSHVSFAIMKDAIAAGVGPDLISTDLVKQTAFRTGGRYGLPMCMSISRQLGMQEEDIFRCVTSAAGQALGRPWGQLAEGGAADLCVLEYADEPFDLTDNKGYRLCSDTGYRCRLTILGGEIAYRG